MSDEYDSTDDILAHIAQVRDRLQDVIDNLELRAQWHDRSKLNEPEKAVFDEYTPKLANTTYGSDEYKQMLEGMGVGLRHHYSVNDHHPEYHQRGVYGMDLIQLIEMLADWKAATMRHADGDLRVSIRQNAARFGYDGAFTDMLVGTAERLGWI